MESHAISLYSSASLFIPLVFLLREEGGGDKSKHQLKSSAHKFKVNLPSMVAENAFLREVEWQK